MAKEKHSGFWCNVWIGVATGVIVSLILQFFSSIHPFSFLWGVAKAIGGYLSLGVTLPLWLYLIPWAVTAFLGLWLVVYILELFHKDPEYFAYTKDHIGSFDWRWQWDRDGDIIRLNPYCPKCLYEPSWIRGYRNETVTLKCDHCGYDHLYEEGNIKVTKSYVRSVMEREIRRKVNTGEWKAVVAGYNKTE